MVSVDVVVGVVLDVLEVLEGGTVVLDIVLVVCWTVVVAAIGAAVVLVVLV